MKFEILVISSDWFLFTWICSFLQGNSFSNLVYFCSRSVSNFHWIAFNIDYRLVFHSLPISLNCPIVYERIFLSLFAEVICLLMSGFSREQILFSFFRADHVSSSLIYLWFSCLFFRTFVLTNRFFRVGFCYLNLIEDCGIWKLLCH